MSDEKIKIEYEAGLKAMDIAYRPMQITYICDARSKWDRPFDHQFRYTLKHRWPIIVVGTILGGLIGAMIGMKLERG